MMILLLQDSLRKREVLQLKLFLLVAKGFKGYKRDFYAHSLMITLYELLVSFP